MEINLDNLSSQEAVKLCLHETSLELLQNLSWGKAILFRLAFFVYGSRIEKELTKHVDDQRALGRSDITDEGITAAFARAGLQV